MVSNLTLLSANLVRMETKEKILDTVSRIATMEVSSSIRWVSVKLAICNEVITNKQNPNKLADVLSICCEVLFGMLQK